MSFQAQIKGWVDEAMHAVLDPLFERVEKIEAYILALENADQIPADPAPRGKGPEASAARSAARTVARDVVADSNTSDESSETPTGKAAADSASAKRSTGRPSARKG
jgi:hypothetical protein